MKHRWWRSANLETNETDKLTFTYPCKVNIVAFRLCTSNITSANKTLPLCSKWHIWVCWSNTMLWKVVVVLYLFHETWSQCSCFVWVKMIRTNGDESHWIPDRTGWPNISGRVFLKLLVTKSFLWKCLKERNAAGPILTGANAVRIKYSEKTHFKWPFCRQSFGKCLQI